MSADNRLKGYIDRVLRLKEEQDTLGDDIREVYAEAKAEGYDKTIMGKLVAHLRKVAKSGEDAVSEQEMNFDTYLQAYHRASGTALATHTHEEEFDPVTGEFIDDRADSGLNIVTKHEDIQVSPETAKENSRPATLAVSGGEPSIPSPDAGGEKMDADQRNPGRSDDMSAYCNAKSGQATNTNPAKATVATQGEATAPTSDDREATGTYAGEDRAAANKGGHDAQQVQHVNLDHRRHFQNEENTSETSELAEQAGGEHEVATGNAERVPTNTTGEGSASALPIKTSIRPLCRNPGDACGGYGRKHCRACETAAAELEAAE